MSTFFQWWERLVPGRVNRNTVRTYEMLGGMPNLAVVPADFHEYERHPLPASWILHAR
jgi:hypothetical protein